MTREEAIKLVDDRMCFGRGKWSDHHMPERDIYWEAGEMAIKALEQPERKKGKWIPHREKSREYIGTTLIHVTYDYWFCDTCGYRVENVQPTYNFCPNCGANMRCE